MSANTRKDSFLIAASLIAVSITVAGLALFPQESEAFANRLFEAATRTFGTLVQLFVFACGVAVLYLAFSKYGHIRLGAGRPEFGNTTWVFMFICAGLGSSTLYWGMMEWAYYYQTPGLNLTPGSTEALEHSVGFTFFHWGISAWAVYALSSLALAYHFHVRKRSGLGLASIVEAVTGFRALGPVGRLVDLVFLLTMFGALTVPLAVTAATLTRGLASLTGIPDTFVTQVLVIGLVALVFSLSSYVGIDGGMQRLAQMVGFGVLGFACLLLVIGPTRFILDNTANAFGITLQNFVRMSLFTDPAGEGAFTRNWTVFYWLWWVSYAPGVAMFVTRVSRGRTVREVIAALVLGGTAGCWFFFGVLGSYSVHQFISGAIDVPGILATQGGEAAVELLLNALPLGKLFLAAYLFLMAVFCASHMDAVAYAVAATSTRNLREGQDPAPTHRLFWCVMLTLIPLAMLFAKASLPTMKTAVVLTAIPFTLILLVMIWGLFRWLLEDYGQVPAQRMAEESRRLAQADDDKPTEAAAIAPAP